MGNLKEIFFVPLFVILDCKTILFILKSRGRGVDSKLAYFTRTYVRGFVATRPFIPTFMFIIMFTFCGVQRTADTSFSVLME